MVEYIVFDIETTGLKPLGRLTNNKKKVVNDDRVTVIAVNSSLGYKKVFFNKSEKRLLKSFNKFINDKRKAVFVGYNIKGFDIPFLLFRILKHNLLFKEDHILNLYFGVSKWSNPFIIDLVDIIKKDWRSFFPLQQILIFLGLDVKNSDGSEAINMWHNKDYDSLKNYVLNDVVVEKKLFDFYRERGLLKWS